VFSKLFPSDSKRPNAPSSSVGTGASSHQVFSNALRFTPLARKARILLPEKRRFKHHKHQQLRKIGKDLVASVANFRHMYAGFNFRGKQ